MKRPFTVLTNGDSQVLIDPRKGGQVVRWTRCGADILHFDSESISDQARPRYGIPVLFPSCGPVPYGYQCDLGHFELPIHGFAGISTWDVDSSSSFEALLTLRSNSRTKAMYPFDFSLTARYRLEAEALEITLTVCNQEPARSMPFALGLHPYLALADSRAVHFSAQDATELLRFSKDVEMTAKHAWRFVASANEGRTILRNAPRIEVRDEQDSLLVAVEHNASWSVVWSDSNAYLAIEPWSCLPGALAAGNALTLEPGESHLLQCRIDVSKSDAYSKAMTTRTALREEEAI